MNVLVGLGNSGCIATLCRPTVVAWPERRTARLAGPDFISARSRSLPVVSLLRTPSKFTLALSCHRLLLVCLSSLNHTADVAIRNILFLSRLPPRSIPRADPGGLALPRSNRIPAPMHPRLPNVMNIHSPTESNRYKRMRWRRRPRVPQ
jgi:hypothetical protein